MLRDAFIALCMRVFKMDFIVTHEEIERKKEKENESLEEMKSNYGILTFE